MAVFLGGCSTPAERYHRLARETGLKDLVLPGAGFELQAFFAPVDAGANATLHVYLDGDGTPWLTPRLVAADPSPRDPLVLRLMLSDSAPTLYLGRPCYLELDDRDTCPSRYWTNQRYSEEVVASLATGLQTFLADHRFEQLVLIGFSGGGTLAMLLAPRLPKTVAVVTLGANLDPDAWTRHHGYLPLTGSLNPMLANPLSSHVYQLHLVGSEDDNILPTVSRVQVEVVQGMRHNCCWEPLWPEILDRLHALEH